MQLLRQLQQRDPGEILVTQQKTLRKVIGFAGMLLPVLLYIFLRLDTGYEHVLPSISHYYYTRVCGIFLMIVSLLAIFLIIYKGRDTIDFILSLGAGLGALLLLLFPTHNLSVKDYPDLDRYIVTKLHETSDFRGDFHLVCAALFLLCLACISFFVFTMSDKSKEARGKQKRRRNRVYRTCSVIMVLALAIIFAGFRGWIHTSFYEGNHLTFWMETVAVEAFGFSWLVKAEVILKDRLQLPIVAYTSAAQPI